jgi:hypothetical protein
MKIKFHDIATGEVVERDMNADELALHKIYAAEAKALDEALKAKQVARLALLDRLGLTEQEAQLLLGS